MKTIFYLFYSFSVLSLSACTIHTEYHVNGYTKEDLRIARCGLGIDINYKPAIQSLIDTDPKVKEQYETCLRELSN